MKQRWTGKQIIGRKLSSQLKSCDRALFTDEDDNESMQEEIKGSSRMNAESRVGFRNCECN